MDTFRESVTRALGDRAEESVAARAIIADEVERFRTASRQRGAAPVVASLRARLESLRVVELERHRAQLADLTEAEWEQVDAATRAALAKLLHEPTVRPEGDGGHAPGRAPGRGVAHPFRPVAVRHGIVALMGTLRLATRGSPLALHQTDLVAGSAPRPPRARGRARHRADAGDRMPSRRSTRSAARACS